MNSHVFEAYFTWSKPLILSLLESYLYFALYLFAISLVIFTSCLCSIQILLWIYCFYNFHFLISFCWNLDLLLGHFFISFCWNLDLLLGHLTFNILKCENMIFKIQQSNRWKFPYNWLWLLSLCYFSLWFLL